MSTRAHLYRTAADNAGNVVPNLTVAVYQAGTTSLLNQPLYTGDTGSGTLANPFVTSTGIIDFYLDDAESVKIGLTGSSGVETVIDNLDVIAPPETTVRATSQFVITNTPASGQFLQCTALGEAAWVDASSLISTQASPLSTLKAYDFSSSSLSDITAQDSTGTAVTVTYVDTTGEISSMPPGYSFTKALRLPTSGVVALRIPPQTFAEEGSITFVYKVIATAYGTSAADLQVVIDNNLMTMTTPTNTEMANLWAVGYVGNIPPGTHSIKILHQPGTDNSSYVLIGNITVQYGNNIPFHTHQGTGEFSTVLGPGASANYDRATVIGGMGQALGTDATVVGASTTAEQQGTALGSTAYAGSAGVALGFYARASSGTFAAIALGPSSQASADNAVAVGSGSSASGARSVAVGSSTSALGVESIALGNDAHAFADGSVAIGARALADTGHTNSVALGADAATTTANQIMFGTPSLTTVIPGTLVHTGPTATLGGASSTLGFYGAAGVIRPVVTGSRQGNTTLAALLTALANLGLISDGTVA